MRNRTASAKTPVALTRTDYRNLTLVGVVIGVYSLAVGLLAQKLANRLVPSN